MERFIAWIAVISIAVIILHIVGFIGYFAYTLYLSGNYFFSSLIGTVLVFLLSSGSLRFLF